MLRTDKQLSIRRQQHARISVIVIMTMLLQIFMPLPLSIFAADSNESFRIVDETIKGEKAYIEWEFDLDLASVVDEVTYDANFTLEDEINDQPLLDKDNVEIGMYSIDTDGKITINIEQKLYADMEVGTLPIPDGTENDMPEVDDDTNSNEGADNGTNDETINNETTDKSAGNGDTSTSDDENNSADNEQRDETINETNETDETNEILVDSVEDNLIETYTGTIIVENVQEKVGFLGMMKGMVPFGGMMPLGGGSGFDITNVEIYTAKPEIVDDGNNITIESQGTIASSIRLNANLEVAIIYDWRIPANAGYTSGSSVSINVPKQIDLGLLANSGELVGGIGSYIINKTTNKITFTFNDKVEENGDDIDGYFYIWVKFASSKFDDGLKQELEFTDTITKTLHFNKNNPNDKITKNGSASNTINPAKIDWVVDINLNEDTIADAVFRDELPSGIILDEDSIEIQELIVKLNGDVIPTGAAMKKDSSELSGKISITPSGSALNIFEINFANLENAGTITKAYRIKYATAVEPIITDPFKGSFTNKAAVLTNETTKVFDKSKKVDVQFSKPLSKKQTAYNNKTQEISWQIDYNFNEQSILSANAVIIDIFDTQYQELIDSSFIVKQATINNNGTGTATGSALTKGTDYSVTTASGVTGGFELQFLTNINKAYIITYKTKAIDSAKEGNRVHDDKQLTNTVSYAGITASANRNIEQGILRKTQDAANGINYADKTIEWQIVFNRDSKTMTNAAITDTFENQHMTFLPNSLSITNLSINTDYTVTTAGAIDGYDKGFIITFLKPITSSHTITYKTKYDSTQSMPSNDGYKNTAGVSWAEGSSTNLSKSAIAYAKLDNYSSDNGNKTGTYNANTKEITWVVDVNYNLHNITDAIFTDYYTGQQKFVENSLVIETLNLSGGANGVTVNGTVDANAITTEPANVGDYQLTGAGLSLGDGGFKLKLGDIDSAYRITYKTSLAGAEISGNYSNNAQLTGYGSGTAYFAKSANITPKNGGEYIRKNGQQGSGNDIDIATWTVGINYSQSHVATGSALTDTLSDNQILLPDTFKLYETTIPVNNSGNVIKGNQITASSIKVIPANDVTSSSAFTNYDYVINIDPDNNGNINKFSLSFNKIVDRPYILEYKAYITANNNENITNSAIYNGKQPVAGNSKTSVKVTFGGAGGGASTGREQIKIIKVDEADNSIKLENAVFELYNFSGSTLLETLITDSNGEAKTVRKYGYNPTSGVKYKLKEITAPNGYLINSDYELPKEILYKNSTLAFTIEDTKIRQAVELTKVDKYDNSINLSGAAFKLQRKVDGSFVDYNVSSDGVNIGTNNTFTTDENGKIYIGDNLAAGDYQFIETQAPEGYWLNTKPVQFKIELNQTNPTTITVENYKHGNLVIKKIDNVTRNPLAGAVFKLVDQMSLGIERTITTLADGIAQFLNLPYGSYKLTEETAPAGYVGVGERNITLKDSTNTMIDVGGNIVTDKSIEIANEKIHQAVKLTKSDSDDNSQRLEGAVFTLHKASDDSQITKDQSNNSIGASYITSGGNEITNTFTTNASGELTVNNLPVGTYYFKEIKAPEFYLLPTGSAIKTGNFTINNNQTTITEVPMTNTRGKGSIEITKHGRLNNDETTRTTLSGISFELYGADKSTTVAAVQITDVNGKTTFSNLDYGTYYLKEVATADDYVLITDFIEVKLDSTDGTQSNGKTVQIDVINQQKTYAIGDYVWIDTNKNGIQDVGENPLAGVKVELFDENSETSTNIAETTTDANGRYIFDNLPAGKYSVKFSLTPTQANTYKFTEKNKTTEDEAITDDEVDSDADTSTGKTAAFTLDDTNTNLTSSAIYTEQAFKATEGIDPTWDAGVVVKPSSGGGGGGGGGTPPEPPKPEEPKKPEEKPEEPKKPEEPFKPTKTEKTEDGKPVIKPKDVTTPLKLIQKPTGNNGGNNGNNGNNKRVPYDPETGIVNTDELEPNVPHEFVVITEIDGKELVVGKVSITVDEDGNVTVEDELIDPYGTVTDCKSGDPAGDVELILYYADTERNRSKGIVPGTLVELPIVEGFMPNHNKNPQISTHELVWSDETGDHGNYGWLVFPETDYYIVAKGQTCETYTSGTISVEWDIIKHDIKMPTIMIDVVEELPKTGEGSRLPYYTAGIVLIGLGLVARKRRFTTEDK